MQDGGWAMLCWLCLHAAHLKSLEYEHVLDDATLPCALLQLEHALVTIHNNAQACSSPTQITINNPMIF